MLVGCLVLIVLNLFVVVFRLQRIFCYFGSKILYFVVFYVSLSGFMVGFFLINVVGLVLGCQVVLCVVGVSVVFLIFVFGYEWFVLVIIGGLLVFWGGGFFVGGYLVDDFFKGFLIILMIIVLVLIGFFVLFIVRFFFERDMMWCL